MKPLILAASISILLAGVAGEAAAACTAGGDVTRVTNLNRLLTRSTVCVPGAVPGTWEWQEQHRDGGELWDFKLGTNPNDPTERVGSWSVTGSGTGRAFVTHNYGSGGSYNYTVYQNGNGSSSTYSFCVGTTQVALATIKIGIIAGCP